MEERNILLDNLSSTEREILMLSLDSNEPNPHGDDFEVDDEQIDSYFLEMEQEKIDSNKQRYDLTDYPDYSDEKLNDYTINRMKGYDVQPPQIIDLDTAPDYVDFVNLSIKNMQSFAGEFDDNSKYDLVKKLLKE